VWRPAFPYRQRRAAFIRGFVRRFWQASTDHRGTPDAPGRVVTLIPEPDATCWGTAYQVDKDERDAILRALDHREKDGYERVYTEATLPGERGAEDHRVPVLVYVATARNPSYLGPAPLPEIAEIARSRVGPSGSNREYVLRLAEALAEMGARDPHVFDLARLLDE